MSLGKMFQLSENVFDKTDFPFEQCQCVKYIEAPVYFLLIGRGDAIEIHVQAEGREGKKHIRKASQLIIKEAKRYYNWAKMLIAPVKSHAIYNMCLKLGFSDLGVVDSPTHGKTRLMVIDYGRCS